MGNSEAYWEKNHNKPAKVGVHLNNSTITAINSNIGSESYIGGMVNARALLGKSPRKRKSENESQAEPDEKSLNPVKMWTLESSGCIVEKIIYEHARTLKYESHLHSFILNDVDKKAQSLFRKEEWEEIFSLNLKVVPKIDKSITELMKKYSVTNLPSFRKTIFEPFLPPSISYSNKEHFYLNYINHAYRAMHTLWEENENFTMNPSSRLEGWYQHNVWSPIDPAFRNFEIDLIRGEGSSMASSDRKNDDTDYEEDRKKIGRKGDGVFRLNGDRLEFGAIEVGKKWEGRNGKKYITDSLKLSKMFRDMLVQLAKECNNDEQIC
ncbi:41321_t:CDS:2 [Gigaspora margarita]|uniref:41321_t:CDS:1 n=1 Tax=Gigaspora margarita TaxID=4874 RepID=A0ABN7W729_GIGMA|nr:41321_t:CDS:2 [Gigaspora margarita]